MYFEPLISVKCCPKLHIKQLESKKQFTLHLSVRSGWVGAGGSQVKRGIQEKGGQDPLTPPPPLDTPMKYTIYIHLTLISNLFGMIKITITLSMDFACRKSRYVVIVCRNHFLQLVFPRKLLRDSIDSFSTMCVGFHKQRR